MTTKRPHRDVQVRWILGLFFAFLVGIGIENLCHMGIVLKAFRNDIYIYRLRDMVWQEFRWFRHDRPGALDVRAENKDVRLQELVERLEIDPPESLRMYDGPAGTGKFVGLGHPALGAAAQEVVWMLVPGHPGASLEIEALGEDDRRQVPGSPE